ncbi:hypothetical protein K443DRAFT_258472 [Laccaria amethystina LaAM-08-1]|uniref:Uncharacterized protein n=1 Tax=Laccaria amethystina LaAM-08-1 TaxID=1095629 RepID=A0A0C9WLE8_9AGAR|nr:hypothetical protein K443DRAFT_258472 [Laccaria amethystina LaAM-08-1]
MAEHQRSTQAIRRSPWPFYIYCVTQPIQSKVYRSTHSSPPPTSPINKLSPEMANETSPFSASASTAEIVCVLMVMPRPTRQSTW